MADVFISAAGMVPFAKYRDRPVEDLARTAILAALEDGGIGRQDVGEAFCGSVYGACSVHIFTR